MLIDETLLDPGCVEIGHAAGRRWGVGLADRPFPSADAPLAANVLGPEPVFVVTGAAGSIVSAITADLAASVGAARSTCWTSLRSPTRPTPTCGGTSKTATASRPRSPRGCDSGASGRRRC